LGQPLAQTLPRLAPVHRPVHPDPTLGGATEHVGREGQDVGGTGSVRVGHDREPERGRQGVGAHLLPGGGEVRRPVDAPMVLEEQRVRLGRVAVDLVHALAELGRRFRQEGGGDAAVGRLPRATVDGPVEAGGGDGDGHAGTSGGIGQDGVEAQPSTSRLPRRPMRVVPQRPVEGEGDPSVVRPEQRGRLHPGVHHVGLGVPGRLQLPHPGHGGTGVRREGERARFRLGPGESQVVRPVDRRAPVAAGGADQQAGPAAAGVEGGGRDLLPAEPRPGQRPAVALRR
jgi:hypothetical protein